MQQLVLVLGAVPVGVLAVAAVAAATILGGAATRRWRIRATARPTGRIVEAAGARVHAIRRGPDGGPTVVLVAGAGGVGASWAGVQDRLAGSVATLAYDRPGLGWSGPARGPRSVAVLADELAGLLAASGAPAPYVLVGHSLGGVIARRYAARHGADVVGLVLVDSAHEELYTRIPEVEQAFRRMASTPGVAVRLMGALTALRGGAPLDRRLPAADAEAVRAATLANADHLPTTLAEARAVTAGDDPVHDLGDLPLVVVRHGRYQRMPMLSADVNDRFEALFADLQGELARLSTRGRLVVAADAGHEIHLDCPDLVVDAIAEVLALERPKGSAPSRTS